MIAIKKYGNNPNYSISNSSGTYSVAFSASYSAVSNLSLDVNTSGFPVLLMVQDDGSGSDSYFGSLATTANDFAGAYLAFFRDSTQLTQMLFMENSPAANNPNGWTPPSFSYMDTPAANPAPGTPYTYTVKIKGYQTGDTAYLYRAKLVVYEIGT